MPQLLGTYYLSLLTESILFAIAALSLDLVWGYTGIPDLGHALWFGTGALAVGMMTTDVDPTGLVLGVHGGLGAHVAGIAIGMARRRGHRAPRRARVVLAGRVGPLLHRDRDAGADA